MVQKKTISTNGQSVRHSTLTRLLAAAGRDFYERGWVLGTSGNFSAVAKTQPLELVITASGADKGALTPAHFLRIDARGEITKGQVRPSDETRLHLTVVHERGAGAVMHTHSVWSTLLSEVFAADREVTLQGFEMLKGLSGVRTHEHRESLPIIGNSQDMTVLSRSFAEALAEYPQCHGVLIRNHGLYTWGRDITEARRHVEILEFLLAVRGRVACAQGLRPS